MGIYVWDTGVCGGDLGTVWGPLGCGGDGERGCRTRV